jgi:prophage regulatory protein
MDTNITIEPGGDLVRGWAGAAREAGKSRVQLWRDIRRGTFPAPIALGPNSVAWFRAEIDAWKRSRPRKTYRPIEASDAGQAA